MSSHPVVGEMVRSSVEIPRIELLCFLELDSQNWCSSDFRGNFYKVSFFSSFQFLSISLVRKQMAMWLPRVFLRWISFQYFTHLLIPLVRRELKELCLRKRFSLDVSAVFDCCRRKCGVWMCMQIQL